MTRPVPILMYHAVAHEPASSIRALSVSPEAFAGQMRLLAERGFTPLTTVSAWRPPGAEGRPCRRTPC